jgi:hypothetical protein
MGLFDSIGKWLGGRTPVAAPAPPPATPPAAPEPAGTLPFPYPLVTVHGSEALATWRRLRDAGEVWPVIIGPDEDIAYLAEGMSDIEERTPAQILATAATLTFPAALQAARAEDNRRALEYLASQGKDVSIYEAEEEAPEIGEWPDEVATTELTVHADYTGKIHERVHIALLPCKTGWEAIAHLRWGNWNANPSAEYHVAALKSWHERHGAELVGLSHDVMNLRVTRRPATREEAMALAREHYLYCNDIVDQGVGSLSALAAALMAGDWWFFWWD